MSPSQTANNFELFLADLKLKLYAVTDTIPFLVILMAVHQTDASIIKVIMKEPWINNSKTFKVNEELNLLQKSCIDLWRN